MTKSHQLVEQVGQWLEIRLGLKKESHLDVQANPTGKAQQNLDPVERTAPMETFLMVLLVSHSIVLTAHMEVTQQDLLEVGVTLGLGLL